MSARKLLTCLKGVVIECYSLQVREGGVTQADGPSIMSISYTISVREPDYIIEPSKVLFFMFRYLTSNLSALY